MTGMPLDLAAIIAQLIELQEKPAPFTRGEALFWDDPHISACMLEAHLDPAGDAASRRPEAIERCVHWLVQQLGLHAGDALLDLGCGPGLYASRFAAAGLSVTGLDYSRRSIEYASRYARDHQLEITYRYENYLSLMDEKRYDGAVLIYGDFCPLNPDERRTLLHNIRRALKPNGRFALDVTTRVCRKKYHFPHGWRAMESGFWKAGPHLLLEQGFDYPEESIWLDQAITLEEDGKVSVYRNWFQDYTLETISAELAENGFIVENAWGDLAGSPYEPEGEWIGLVTRKK